MRLTKLGHACVRLEKDGATLVIDPGAWSGPDPLAGAQAVLITHEHPDHLEALLERYPNFHLDTSATKWQVREVSARPREVRDLICRHPDRFLFGSDLVTRHDLVREHYVSRYWCQRTLWESDWMGPSPIADPDYTSTQAGQTTPTLQGLGLPDEVVEMVYYRNAQRLLQLPFV